MWIEHLGQIQADRFRDQREEAEKEGELQPVGGVHGRGSEFFRMNHGHEEVAEEGEGDEPDDDGFHGGGGSERGAETGVDCAEGEEGRVAGEEEEVGHGFNGQVIQSSHERCRRVANGRVEGVKNALERPQEQTRTGKVCLAAGADT